MRPTKESLRCAVDAYLTDRVLAASEAPGADHVPVPVPPLGKVKRLPVVVIPAEVAES